MLVAASVENKPVTSFTKGEIFVEPAFSSEFESACPGQSFASKRVTVEEIFNCERDVSADFWKEK